MSILTTEKKNFFKFKNKVSLANFVNFGYFPNPNPLNNELLVYLNKTLNDAEPVSITNFNIGSDIKDVVKLFWDSKTNPADINQFYDDSIFTGSTQPSLTEYIEYKGNIFELYERLSQYVKTKVTREQEVKTKYISWFDIDFLTINGLKRLATYTFNLNNFANKLVDSTRKTNTIDLTYKFNEYFRINTSASITDKEMYVTANSNSLIPSRIYYKKIETQIASNNFETKFIFPLYLTENISLLSNITGLVVLRNLSPTEVRQSVSY
jgi:hypothetical protein